MNVALRDLAERIRGELPQVGRAAERASLSWDSARRNPEEVAYLDSVALNLHGFYSGLERLFELIARFVDGVEPSGNTWHRDLLKMMAQDKKEVRPAVLSVENVSTLDEFRRFRHLVRNVYSMNIIPKRLEPLVTKLPALWDSLRRELLAFADFIDALADG